MGRITVVNLTDAPIQSAIANAGSIHSGINGILPHVYYHHNALSGTGYDVMEKWYLPGIVEEFPSSDLSKIGWYIGGALLTALGIVTTVLSAGALSPLWAAYGAAAATASVSAAAASTAANAAMAAAIAAAAADAAAASAALATFSAAVAGTGLGVVIGAGGIAGLIAQPTIDALAAIKERRVGTVWGQSDRILKFTGKLPLEVGQGKDAEGKPTPVLQLSKGITAEKASPPTFAGDLTWDEFDMMRRIGEIYQIKHRNGEYCDMTQGLVRLNLRGAGGKERVVSHAGAAIDISKIYKLWIVNPADRVYPSCLMAGEDEGDNRVYLRKVGEDQELSCCYWQFIPTRKGGADGKGGWLIIDRRYARFLYWSGSEILQYQSEEVGESGIKITPDGWAEWDKQHEPLKGMVWNLPPFAGSSAAGMIIEQPGTERICVTGRTDQGRAIYARPFGSHDVFQVWALGAMK